MREVVLRVPAGRADFGFALGEANDRVLVKVTVATLRMPERGTHRISAQALVRTG